MKRRLLRWFDLREDQAPSADIDTALRHGARVGGTNLWVLFFAMLIASVGLNVNSTAVIIGAMLISPLMGPIVGMGYGAAIADLRLIRSAALNLAVFTALSLATSTLYFLISPLNEPGSELMARTSPTMWDVLIAAFGGAAGMVAVTRRSFNNIVPGVAIATALMPPLCTVGFGIAHLRWDMAAGALYLFTINGVFIAASSLLVARLLRLPRLVELDERTRNLHRWAIGLGLTAVLVPSVWLGYRLVQDEVFTGAAQRVLQQLSARSEVTLLATQIEARERRIDITVVGEADEQRLLKDLTPVLASEGLKVANLRFRRAGDAQWQRLQQRGDQREQRVNALAADLGRVQEAQARLLAETQAAIKAAAAQRPSDETLLAELHAWLPHIHGLAVSGDAGQPLEARVLVSRPLSQRDAKGLEAWLQARLRTDALTLIQQTGQPAAKP